MLILYHGEAGPRQLDRFRQIEDAHGVTIEVCAQSDDARLAELLPDVDVWWHILRPITAAHLDAAPNLRLIHKWGVGVNTIDVAGAAARDVAVANMPGSNAPAVAEAALMLMLSVVRQLPTFAAETISNRGWSIPPAIGERNRELAGATVGLVGYGDVAQRLALVLDALGARVVHHSLRTDRPGWLPLDELLAVSDIVSLHVPLTPATDLLMDAERIALSKPGAVLINTARGGLVDLDALSNALRSGHLSGAGLDVFPEEPWNSDHPIIDLPEVIVTPHVAWLTWETLERSLDLAIANVVAVRDGRPLTHRVEA